MRKVWLEVCPASAKVSGLVSYASQGLVNQNASGRLNRVCGSESCNFFGNHWVFVFKTNRFFSSFFLETEN